MEFDSGIEIFGYINVSIDRAVKVDYVLNEHVQKRTDNSMTFVSNSFLARKDNSNRLRDSSCSPVPELIQPPSSPFLLPGTPYSTNLHSKHIGRKRSRRGRDRDWRVPSKFVHFPPGNFPHNSGSSSQLDSLQTLPSPQSQQGSNFHTFDGIIGNIKKDPAQNQQDYFTTTDKTEAGSTTSSNGNISNAISDGVFKTDPGNSLPIEQSNTEEQSSSAVSETQNMRISDVRTDIDDNNLEQHQHQSSVNNKELDGKEQDYRIVGEIENASAVQHILDDRNNVEESENLNETPAHQSNMNHQSSSYGPHIQSEGDGGEAPSLEFIEIEDEDEDIQVMFENSGE